MTTHRPVLSLAFATAIALAGCSPAEVSPVVGQRCEGVPARICQRMLEEAHGNAPNPRAAGVVGIHIRCTAAACTEAAGEASITVTYADGQTVTGSEGWASAPAAPVFPAGDPPPPSIEPECVGVDRDTCLAYAAEGLADAQFGAAEPVSVLVRCTTACDTGDGETVVQLADGSTRTVGWSYPSLE